MRPDPHFQISQCRGKWEAVRVSYHAEAKSARELARKLIRLVKYEDLIFAGKGLDEDRKQEWVDALNDAVM